MIVLNLKLDNILAFKDFEVNFSYPRKLKKTLIEGEHLRTIPTFRYKKLVVLIGSNATGKTSLIKLIWRISLFLHRKNPSFLDSLISENNEHGNIEIDFVNEYDDVAILYRAKIRIIKNNVNNQNIVEVAMYSKKLTEGDSYENSINELDNHEYVFESWQVALQEFYDNFGWQVVLPSTEELFDKFYIHADINESEKDDYLDILNNVMKTLDPAIKNVFHSKDAADAIVIEYSDERKVLIQNGNDISSIPLLSSGTKYGVEISNILFSIKNHRNGLYLVDEQFSYVTADIETAILAKMTALLNSGEQLFFTTHNSNILELGFPFHSFYFMKKTIIDGAPIINVSCASELENRNNVSPKNMFDNDAFGTAPNVDGIYSIGK